MKSLTAFMAVVAAVVLVVLLAGPASAEEVYCSDFPLCEGSWYHCIDESLNCDVIIDCACVINEGVTINGNIVGLPGDIPRLAVYGQVNGNIKGELYSTVINGTVGNIDLSKAWRIHVLGGGVARRIHSTVEMVIIGEGGTAANVDVTTEDYLPGPGYPEGVQIEVLLGQVYNGNVSEEGPGYVKIWMSQGSIFNGNVSEKGEGDLDFYDASGDAIVNGSIKEQGDGVCHNEIINFNGNEKCDD